MNARPFFFDPPESLTEEYCHGVLHEGMAEIADVFVIASSYKLAGDRLMDIALEAGAGFLAVGKNADEVVMKQAFLALAETVIIVAGIGLAAELDVGFAQRVGYIFGFALHHYPGLAVHKENNIGNDALARAAGCDDTELVDSDEAVGQRLPEVYEPRQRVFFAG